ncbi:MAG: amidohydrolase [Litorilinea sp.]
MPQTTSQTSATPAELLAAAQAIFPQLQTWRRDFHAHPELGYQEVRTAGIVADHLRDLGLEVTTGVGKTGVVALLEADNTPADAPTVLLRFDMDALPIHEENDLPYRSQNDGVMHACGHDGHTAIGMGVAQLLAERRNSLSGRVKLVFQPAEEGLGGAARMIQDGALADPVPAAAFGLHLWSRLPLNQVVVQSGPLWASAGMFNLTVEGRGGHGAAPHETIDATLVASQIVVAWQSIVARNVDPTQTAVLTVGSFHSGDQGNIIAGRAKLTGTIRSFDPQVDDLLKQRMAAMAEHICAAHGATCTLEHNVTVPATINSEAGAALLQPIAAAVVGADQVTQITPMMVAEDMSEFLNRAPGCFILIGASDPAEGWHSPHHNATFNFDERVMPVGAAILTATALEYLTQNRTPQT